MAKGIQKVKVKIKEDEVIHVFKKGDALLVFSDLPDDPTRCGVEILLPEDEILKTKEYSQSVSMSVAIGNKLIRDNTFAPEMLTWMEGQIKKAEMERVTSEQIIKEVIK